MAVYVVKYKIVDGKSACKVVNNETTALHLLEIYKKDKSIKDACIVKIGK